LFRPTQVHPQKHFRPVLRLGAAGAGLNREDGVQAVVFARQKRFGFEVGDIGVRGGDFLRQVLENRVALRIVGFFLREMKIGVQVADLALERFLSLDAILELFALLQGGLRLFLVLPEIQIVYFFFEGGTLLPGGRGVKDSSAPARCASGARRSAVAGLRYVQPCDSSIIPASDMEAF
jgi:hypothetical protein